MPSELFQEFTVSKVSNVQSPCSGVSAEVRVTERTFSLEFSEAKLVSAAGTSLDRNLGERSLAMAEFDSGRGQCS